MTRSHVVVWFVVPFSARPVLDVGSHVLQLREDLREEPRLGVYPEHRGAQAVDDGDAAVPEALLVRLHKERLQGVTDLVAHVAGKMKHDSSVIT